jgi:hypothetical protein
MAVPRDPAPPARSRRARASGFTRCAGALVLVRPTPAPVEGNRASGEPPAGCGSEVSAGRPWCAVQSVRIAGPIQLTPTVGARRTRAPAAKGSRQRGGFSFADPRPPLRGYSAGRSKAGAPSAVPEGAVPVARAAGTGGTRRTRLAINLYLFSYMSGFHREWCPKCPSCPDRGGGGVGSACRLRRSPRG